LQRVEDDDMNVPVAVYTVNESTWVHKLASEQSLRHN